MTITPVFLWSDLFLFFIVGIVFALILHMRRQPHLCEIGQRIISNRMAYLSLIIFSGYFSIAFLDSLHFRENHVTKSVLEAWLAPIGQQDEKSYSAPFSSHLFVKETQILPNGQVIRDTPPLRYKAQGIQGSKIYDIAKRSGIALSKAIGIGLGLGVLLWLRRRKLGREQWTYLMGTVILIAFSFVAIDLEKEYYILGTDQIGRDIFYIVIKSIRTDLLIAILTLGVTIPLSIFLGMIAGYFRGILDDIVQYVYTTLSSVPNVLLIAAAILSLQIFITNHPQYFPTTAERADIRLLALCFILGITSWTNLCRLLRAETLKLREMDYVQAALVLGTPHRKILLRHIFPNLMHIVLIIAVLDFSALVLAEAVLSYLGVGVDPSTLSWGNMINSARLELSRDPMVWWPLAAAFVFMFTLVIAANLIADTLRDAFDPRMKDVTP